MILRIRYYCHSTYYRLFTHGKYCNIRTVSTGVPPSETGSPFHSFDSVPHPVIGRRVVSQLSFQSPETHSVTGSDRDKEVVGSGTRSMEGRFGSGGGFELRLIKTFHDLCHRT